MSHNSLRNTLMMEQSTSCFVGPLIWRVKRTTSGSKSLLHPCRSALWILLLLLIFDVPLYFGHSYRNWRVITELCRGLTEEHYMDVSEGFDVVSTKWAARAIGRLTFFNIWI